MDKVTGQRPQTTTFLKRKESRSGIDRGPSAYQPNGYRQAKPRRSIVETCIPPARFKSFTHRSPTLPQRVHRRIARGVRSLAGYLLQEIPRALMPSTVYSDACSALLCSVCLSVCLCLSLSLSVSVSLSLSLCVSLSLFLPPSHPQRIHPLTITRSPFVFLRFYFYFVLFQENLILAALSSNLARKQLCPPGVTL